MYDTAKIDNLKEIIKAKLASLNPNVNHLADIWTF